MTRYTSMHEKEMNRVRLGSPIRALVREGGRVWMSGVAGKKFVLTEPTWSLEELRLYRPEAEAGTGANATHKRVTPAMLSKLAKLALIDLSQQPNISADQLEEDVNVILRCASSLRSFTAADGGAGVADVTRVVTVAEPLTPSQLRKDTDAQTIDMSEELLRNSRDSHDGFFVAPKD